MPWEAAAAALWGGGPVIPSWAAAAALWGGGPVIPSWAAAAALWGGGPVIPSWAAAAREKEKDGSTVAEDAKHLLITSRTDKSSAHYFCCSSQTPYRITEKYRFQLGLTEYLGR